MKYVIKAFDRYYIRDIGGALEELYDLDYATVFSSKEEAEKICNESTLSKYFKIVELSEEQVKYTKWKNSGMLRRVLPKIDKKISRKYKGESIPEIIEFFKYATTNEDKIAQKEYSTWPRLYTKCKVLHDVVSYWDDSYTKTTSTVSIAVKKDSNYDIFEKEINTALPSITHIVDGYYVLPIVDFELCYYDSRNLLIEVGKIPISHSHKCKITGNRFRDLYKGSLMDCFKELKKTIITIKGGVYESYRSNDANRVNAHQEGINHYYRSI